MRKKDKRKQILASTILVILLIAAFMFGRILLFTIPNLMDEKEKNDSEKSAAVVEKEEDSEQNQQEDDDKKTKITEALKEAEKFLEKRNDEEALSKVKNMLATYPTSEKLKEKETEYTKADSFYGIWCGASKTEAEAQKQVNAVKESGFDARMFVTTDWSNLNSEKCT